MTYDVLNRDPRKNNATNVTGIITFGNVIITVRPDTTGLSSKLPSRLIHTLQLWHLVVFLDSLVSSSVSEYSF